MTKKEARALMGEELVRCVSENIERLPSHIKIDSKGTKTYVSFKDFGVYVCFYVTSSLYYSLWRFSVKEVDTPAVLYDKYRSEEDVRALTRAAFLEVLRWLEEDADLPVVPTNTAEKHQEMDN